MSAVATISRRAKQIQQADKRLTWQQAIKKAGAEYRAGKIGRVKKKGAKKVKQTGNSNTTRDKLYKAKAPGWRRSKATGNRYFENRKNRSDAPGRVTGLYKPLTSQLAEELSLMEMAKLRYNSLRKKTTRGLTALEKSQLKAEKKQWLDRMRMHKKNIIAIKRQIK